MAAHGMFSAGMRFAFVSSARDAASQLQSATYSLITPIACAAPNAHNDEEKARLVELGLRARKVLAELNSIGAELSEIAKAPTFAEPPVAPAIAAE